MAENISLSKNIYDQDIADAAFAAIYDVAPDAYRSVRARFADLSSMRSVLERMPLVSRASRLHTVTRSADSLIDELLRTDRGDRLLYLPVRAVFGRAVAVAEAQVWAALAWVCAKANIAESKLRGVESKATQAVLGLMAEDVYRDMLDGEAPEQTKRAAAKRLVALWDARPEDISDPAAEALAAVWVSRRVSPPVFGTLLGSSELMGLSMGLDEHWFAFARDRFSDSDVSEALGEFLFGLSHEEIAKASSYIEKNGPQNPEGLKLFFGTQREYPEASSSDPRDLYRFYEARRKRAKERVSTGIAGPQATLEELYLRWTIEQEIHI